MLNWGIDWAIDWALRRCTGLFAARKLQEASAAPHRAHAMLRAVGSRAAAVRAAAWVARASSDSGAPAQTPETSSHETCIAHAA